MLNLPIHVANLNQVQHAQASAADLRTHAKFTVSTHAASFPNADTKSQLARGGLAVGWLASDRHKARQVAERCGPRLRASAARLLWQLGQSDGANAQLRQKAGELQSASNLTYPAPGGKRESTRQQLGDFLQHVVQQYAACGRDDRKMAAWLQLTAEFLQALADRGPKENG